MINQKICKTTQLTILAICWLQHPIENSNENQGFSTNLLTCSTNVKFANFVIFLYLLMSKIHKFLNCWRKNAFTQMQVRFTRSKIITSFATSFQHFLLRKQKKETYKAITSSHSISASCFSPRDDQFNPESSSMSILCRLSRTLNDPCVAWLPTN